MVAWLGISWFNVTVALLCVVGVATLMISVHRTLKEELFPLYMAYMLFTAFALMIQALQVQVEGGRCVVARLVCCVND